MRSAKICPSKCIFYLKLYSLSNYFTLNQNISKVMKRFTSFADDELVSMYASGTDEAFDVLLERYKDKLYSNILFAVRNEDLADDIFQETFVKAIMTIRDGKYVETGRFFPWLSRIAYNLVIDQFRVEKNERFVSNDEVDYDLFNSVKLADTHDQMKQDVQQVETDLHRLINHLPSDQKEIVMMHYFHDKTFREIADLKSISINTALGRMRYGIINLRKMALKYNIQLS